MALRRRHSIRVALGQEATAAPELKEFAELQCWATRMHASRLKRPAKKWLRLRDFTLYWCKSPVETQAEGCIRFLYDDVSLEKMDNTQIKFKCRDKDRVFDFNTALDANRWYDRCSKALIIRDNHGSNFAEDGRSVFSNVCNMFLLNNSEWIAVGQGTLSLLVDTKQSGGVPDVAAVMTIQSDTGSKSYEFLLCPYIKPKGNKTWIIPKCMDMNTEFNQQTLAFRFKDESDAQIFQNVFDGTFRSTDTDTKVQGSGRIGELEQENAKLRDTAEQLRKKCDQLREKKDALKNLLQQARLDGDEADAVYDDDDDDAIQPDAIAGGKRYQPFKTGKLDHALKYRVVGEDGITVRASIETSSREVCIVPTGEIVDVVEIQGRRARVITPVEGWCSLHTAGGYVCLEMLPKEEQPYPEDIVEEKEQNGGGASSQENERLRRELQQMKRKYSDLERQKSQNQSMNSGGQKSWTKEEVLQWTAQDVGNWLEGIGLARYRQQFEELDVDGSILVMDLDDNLLEQDLDVKGYDKNQIMDLVTELHNTGRLRGGGGGGGGGGYDAAADNARLAELEDQYEQQIQRMREDHQAELDRQRQRMERDFDNERRRLEKQLNDKDERIGDLRQQVNSAGAKSGYNSGYGGGGGGLSQVDIDRLKGVLTGQMEDKAREVKELQQANMTLHEELAKKTKRLIQLESLARKQGF